MVIVDKKEFDAELEGNPEALTVQEALNRTVRSRRVGGLAVDTESLRVGETGENVKMIISVRMAFGFIAIRIHSIYSPLTLMLMLQ